MLIFKHSDGAVVPGAADANTSGSKQSLLLRLFESKMFDMSYAIVYLFNSKEAGVQTYIGNRIFSYPTRDVDFYLQQLVNMYIHMHDVAEVIHPYLVRGSSITVSSSSPMYSCSRLIHFDCAQGPSLSR